MDRTIFLEASDVWLFRDGRPFQAGQEHRATSMFPPHPSVVYGALRTAGLLAENVVLGPNFSSPRFGSPEQPGNFRFLGPVLSKDRKLLFPCPLDVVREKGEDHDEKRDPGKLHRLVPLRGIEARGDTGGFPFLHAPGTGEVEGIHEYLDAEGLAQWLEGKIPGRVIESEEIYGTEDRIGLALDDPGGRRPHPGHLYIAGFIRPREGVELAGWVQGDGGLLGRSGNLRLGGDGHTARYEILEKGPALPPPPAGPRKGAAILLLTPALFGDEKGTTWKPEKFLKETGLTLVAAAVGRSLPVGGWDLVRDRPKPTRRAVPAGSVFFCHCEGPGSYQKAMDRHGTCISDLLPEAGFGLAAVGGWNHV